MDECFTELAIRYPDESIKGLKNAHQTITFEVDTFQWYYDMQNEKLDENQVAQRILKDSQLGVAIVCKQKPILFIPIKNMLDFKRLSYDPSGLERW